MQPLTLTAMTTANPLGLGLAATWDGLRHDRHGLRPNDFEDATIKTWIGRIDGLETEPITGALAEFDCRNNRLALVGIAPGRIRTSRRPRARDLRTGSNRCPDRNDDFRHSRN